MLTLISPAKSLELEKPFPACSTTTPVFLQEAVELNQLLKKLKQKDLEKLMDISPKLAELNVERNARFSIPFDSSNARPALYTFDGDVYAGLDAFSMNKKSVAYAQDHLRILSGLYGLLKPLDLMQAYRLEMGTALKNKKGKDLYAFWRKKLTEQINAEMKASKSKILLNLASEEYFGAVDPKGIEGEVVTCMFKDKSGATYKVLSFHAKKARGLMTRFIMDHKIEKKEHLKTFDASGYLYNEAQSKPDQLVFLRG